MTAAARPAFEGQPTGGACLPAGGAAPVAAAPPAGLRDTSGPGWTANQTEALTPEEVAGRASTLFGGAGAQERT
jgi:hypothetical protein